MSSTWFAPGKAVIAVLFLASSCIRVGFSDVEPGDRTTEVVWSPDGQEDGQVDGGDPMPQDSDSPGDTGGDAMSPGDTTLPPLRCAISLSRVAVAVDHVATVSVEILDDGGVPVGTGGQTVAFEISGGTSEGLFGSTIDNGDGTYEATFTGTAAGTSVQVNAMADSVPLLCVSPSIRVDPAISTRALLFDGSEEYVELGDIALPTGTISLWIRTTSAARGYPVSRVVATGSERGELRLIIDAGYVTIRVETPDINEITSDAPIHDGVWHHLVVTFNPGLRLYVDGVEAQQTNESVDCGMEYPGLVAQLARNNALHNDYFAGALDELTFYNRKLDADEVSELWNDGVPTDPRDASTEASLVHWWPLGEADLLPTLPDNKGASNGTAFNMDISNLATDTP